MFFKWIRRAFATAYPKKYPKPLEHTGLRGTNGRTYREELYGGRRVIIDSDSASHGLRRMFEILKVENVIGKIRSKREFVRPGVKRGIERARRRKERFNAMVTNTVNDIKGIYRRLK